jgi:hypothetical protein
VLALAIKADLTDGLALIKNYEQTPRSFSNGFRKPVLMLFPLNFLTRRSVRQNKWVISPTKE